LDRKDTDSSQISVRVFSCQPVYMQWMNAVLLVIAFTMGTDMHAATSAVCKCMYLVTELVSFWYLDWVHSVTHSVSILLF